MTKKEFMKAWDWENETDEGIYDAKEEVFYFLDVAYGDDDCLKLYGAQYKENTTIDEIKELVMSGRLENEFYGNFWDYVAMTCPAPGTWCQDRLGFWDFDNVENVWDEFKNHADYLYTETEIIEMIKRGELA